MKIAMVAAEFSPDEANQLRKAMATFRSRGTIEKLEGKMVSRIINRGYDPEFARRCFNQIKGFGDYGFPESHAASFAHLVYVSSWIKCHYPDVFCTALLNSQPMGFYAPAQIVRDAREHGVTLREADVNYSDWDNTLEPISPGVFAVRLGLRQIDGMKQIMVGMAGKGIGERMKMARQLQENGMFNAGGRIAKVKQSTTGGLSASERAKLRKRRQKDKKKGKGKKKRR